MSRRPPTADTVEMSEGEGVHTFSNGSEWDCWASHNCYTCKWWDAETAGAGCAFEALAFIHRVTPALALLFGWTQTTTEYGPLSGWEPPPQCAFHTHRDEHDEDSDVPPPPVIDPTQLTFLAPQGWPDAVSVTPPLAPPAGSRAP